MPADLMDRLVFLMEVFLRSDETLFYNFGVANFVKDTIATKEKKIHLVIDGELHDIGNSNNNIRISSKLLSLSLNISKGSRY